MAGLSLGILVIFPSIRRSASSCGTVILIFDLAFFLSSFLSSFFSSFFSWARTDSDVSPAERKRTDRASPNARAVRGVNIGTPQKRQETLGRRATVSPKRTTHASPRRQL